MKLAIWKTGHQIADTVADVVAAGIPIDTPDLLLLNTMHGNAFGLKDRINIGYGILRGMDRIFNTSEEWFHIDKGYWGAGHFDGNYRISYKGTQQTTNLDKLEPDYDWVDKNIQFEDWKNGNGYHLICPPTKPVCDFFDIEYNDWIKWAKEQARGERYFIKPKDSPMPLDVALSEAKSVITFNSTVGLEALRRGIPVISNPEHSLIGAWFKDIPLDELAEAQYNERRKLFATIPRLQFTLEEARAGKVWQIIQQLQPTLVGIQESKQQLKWLHTA